jgi:hypothetical protein
MGSADKSTRKSIEPNGFRTEKGPMMRYVMTMALIALLVAPVRAQSPVPTPQIEQQEITDPAIAASEASAVTSAEAKQVNPQARQTRHRRTSWISVAPLIVAVAFIVIAAIVVPK